MIYCYFLKFKGAEMIAIDSGKIAAMVAQMRSAVATVQAPVSPVIVGQTQGSIDFGQVFKSQMDQVNGLHKDAEKLGERFSLGDDSVNMSDVMIALQATVQARNKLVTAYHDIMNMQV